MKRYAIFAAVIFLCSLTMFAGGLEKALQAELEKLQQETGVPGVSLGVVLPDGKVIALAAGYADLEEKIKMTPKHRIFAGSIGKTYVAAVAMKLLKEKKISLDDKVAKYFGKEKWFPRLPNGKDLTVRMVMNHTGGLPRYVFKPAFTKLLSSEPDKVYTPVERLAFIFDDKPVHPAGDGWAYSDTDYIVLGMIIEKVTGRTYYELVKEWVLDPHHLDTTAPSDHRDIKGLPAGYSADKQPPFNLPGKVVANGVYVTNPQFEWTGGGLVTSTADLARFFKLLLEGKIVAPEQLEMMKQVVGFQKGKPAKEGYGLGLMARETPGGMVYYHTGLMPGYTSRAQYVPKYRFAIALQVNADMLSGKLKKPEQGREPMMVLKNIIVEHLSKNKKKTH